MRQMPDVSARAVCAKELPCGSVSEPHNVPVWPETNSDPHADVFSTDSQADLQTFVHTDL